VEYAYRHKDDYSQILWVKAESQESLTSDFSQLATVLNLPEQKAQDQQDAVNAALFWLKQHDQWLLIFDNADELSLIHPFIQGLERGHVLLTTRAQATKIFPRVEVKELPNDEAARFLLRRAKLLDKETPQERVPLELHQQALDIVIILNALTLALDQAGAYIEETQCSFDDYLKLYKSHGIELLKERGLFAPGHPDPVATTWVLSYQNIEQANPAAAELLRFCAFLAPDAIPEELITQSASELGDLLGPVAENPLLLNKSIGEILKYSLINREIRSKTLDIHRLVQAVIQDSLDEETKVQGRERVVRAMNHVFPEVEFKNWPQCDRLLPQSQHCASFIMTNDIQIPEASSLLNKTARYLHERARYTEAESLYQRALAIREQALSPTHPDVATSLNNLAWLYYNQGKYPEAEPLFQRALAIREQALGPTHPDVATSLNNLARLYDNQGKAAEAEPLYQRALAIYEEALGPTHPDVAKTLNDLGELFKEKEDFEEAKNLFKRSLKIFEQTLGRKHPRTETVRENYEGLLGKMGEAGKGR
jgi:tetratricopeptide (TPR) repeat protein